MKEFKHILATVLVTAACVFTGCGSEGNKVIQPTETYQPTATEKANAEKHDKLREELEGAGDGNQD